MFPSRRRRLFLDSVQTTLMLRVVAYWFFCLLAAALMACCWIAWAEPPASSGELFARALRVYGPVLGATTLLLPLVVMDVLRLSNRFVGPVYRLRHALRQAAHGEAVAPIQFRDNDYWRDVAEDFNRACASLNEETTSA